jgi:hypothetical protein
MQKETWLKTWQQLIPPKASENASAIAIVKIPPIITNLDPEKECSPTINPSVVIIAEVKPKLNPCFMECFVATTPLVLDDTTLRSFKAYYNRGNFMKSYYGRLASVRKKTISTSFEIGRRWESKILGN